ncbi:sialidase [Sulfurifustis variabilis]|uniref:Sialidase n=1 Tax=Sulfurifustis variabilis TaxID=1675686 RepID=A0A1B4VEL1_9GAMM|nr:sialidase [Sulfurifustis variabilis]BAU49117.1 sialidase [Sulfurifustis variabilis]
MSNRFLVGTRKGLFTFERASDSRWRIVRTDFLGDPVTMVLPMPDGRPYAALNLGHFGSKLRRLGGAGKWEECAVPAFPAVKDGGENAPAVMQIWSLERGDPDGRTLWAGTIPGGLFRSRDGGGSWQLMESLWNRPEREEWMGGGYDQPGIHSICVDPRDPGRLALAVSTGGVWTTSDQGATWECRGKGLRAAYMPAGRAFDPLVQDVHRLVQCPARPDVYWAQHHNGIFRSTDDAANWEEIADAPLSTFGFAVAVHPRDPDTAWFVPAVKDETRIPVDAKLAVMRTRDGGRRFEVLRRGLPQEHAYDLVYRHGLDIDDSGDRLAMGSTTGGLWLSEDQGDTWQNLSSHMPPIYCVRFTNGG